MTELTNDVIFGGAGGALIGYAMGWTIKKAFKLLFKFIIVIAIFYIGSLIYLKSVGVIRIHEEAAKNLIENTQNNVNNLLGTSQICDSALITSNGNEIINNECVNNIVSGVPVSNIITSMGLPLTFGLGLGLLIGWTRG